jgi:alpha-D-ribose 1-methylphosphonate 5-triphosphate synthase subunit PhnI
MDARRRVSPAYKDVPGGQMLGATKDYTRRLLDFDLLEERQDRSEGDPEGSDGGREGPAATAADEERLELTNVMDLLRERGLVREPAGDPPEEPSDTTREPVTHPPERDEVLQELARGETGAITALGYSSLRGYGQVHPTLAEVRVGRLPVRIEHPYTGEPVRVTEATVTECEAVVPVFEKREQPAFAFGYGLTFGRNERKAIGMSVLDAAIQLDSEAEPAENPEFVLDTVDGLDSFGFIEHLKLPHYVTFQSILDRIESIRERGGPGGPAAAADRREDPEEGEADD